MMKMRILSLVSLMAILHAPAVFSAVVDGTLNPHHVPGESLDNGLGELPASYTAAEFQRVAARSTAAASPAAQVQPVAVRSTSTTTVRVTVIGEKQDSGLGDLPPDYTGAEFQRNSSRVAANGRRL